MNRVLAVLAMSVAVAGCKSETSTSDRAVDAVDATPVAAEFNAVGLPTVAFSVPNMMCEDSCVPTVRAILAEQPGVQGVEVVLDTKTATVAIDGDQFDADAAIAALLDMQFEDTVLITASDSSEATDVGPEEIGGDAAAPDATASQDADG